MAERELSPIMAPAVRIRGEVFTAMPGKDDGTSRSLVDHLDAATAAMKAGHSMSVVDRELSTPGNLGFVDTTGAFKTRREAIPAVLRFKQLRTAVAHKSALLQRQLEQGHSDPALDSGDLHYMTKSYTFETVTNERSATHHDLKVRMTHQGSGKAVIAKLSRHHTHPEGQWEMETVMRPVGQQSRPLSGLGGWTDPGNANTIGVAGIRALARHLKDTYGVTKLTGARISGARRNAPVVKQYVNVNLTKAQAQFTELEHIKDPEFTGLTVRVMHPDGKQGADLHLMRQHDHPEGHWHIMNVDPVDTTLSIEGHVHSRAFANRLGPGIIRQTVRHLKNTYGITSVRGFRVSGSRFGGQPDDHASIERRNSQPVSVKLGKALPPIFREVRNEHVAGGDVHSVEFDAVNPAGHGARVYMSRSTKIDPPGTYEISNVRRIIGGKPVETDTYSREHANTLGPSFLKPVMRHMQQNYGVTKVSGVRVTGVRNPGHGTQPAAPTDKNRVQIPMRPLAKAFQDLVDRLEKARVTPVFRATSTPPDASGRMTFRDNPLLGVTYFANTPEGASGAALTNAHDTRSDKWPRHVAATAVTREHRIYGHNMPLLVPESRVQARLAHFDRVAARAPHEGIGNIIRHLASREANRSHKVVADAQGNKYRKYKEAHLPLFFAEVDGHKPHYSDNGPVPSNHEEWRAMKDSHPAHAKMRSVFQMALHHMGYHGTAVTDEGGSWNEWVRPAGNRGPRNQGSIALFPKVASGLHATARPQKDNEKPDLQERINERRPGGFVRKPGIASRVIAKLFGRS